MCTSPGGFVEGKTGVCNASAYSQAHLSIHLLSLHEYPPIKKQNSHLDWLCLFCSFPCTRDSLLEQDQADLILHSFKKGFSSPKCTSTLGQNVYLGKIGSEVMCKCFLPYSIRMEHSCHSGDEYVKEDFECFEIMEAFSPNGAIVRRQSEVEHAWVNNTVWMGQGSARKYRCRAISNKLCHGHRFLVTEAYSRKGGALKIFHVCLDHVVAADTSAIKSE
jgi:hypothetical protein